MGRAGYRVVIEAPARRERTQSLGEEIANSVSHGVGLLAAVATAPVLVLTALQRGGVSGILGVSVFPATMVVLYLASTLYHALPRNRAKRVFQVLDHGAIYLLIAGTYTPFTLGRAPRPVGLDAVRARVGSGRCWYRPQGCRRDTVPGHFDMRVSRHGVARPHRGKAISVPCATEESVLAPCRRHRVHGGCSVFRREAGPLRPFRLAPVRYGRHRISLHRGAVVRGLSEQRHRDSWRNGLYRGREHASGHLGRDRRGEQRRLGDRWKGIDYPGCQGARGRVT